MPDENNPRRASLRLVAWNLGHRTREVAIPTGFFRAIELIRPDVLILNEFRDGPTRRDFRARLGALGLGQVLVSHEKPGHNQVLIASRTPIDAGDVLGPRSPDDHAFTNFLHVRHPASGLEIVGIRAPAYATVGELDTYWRHMGSVLRAVASRPIVFAGDFNVEPEGARSGVYSLFSDLLKSGWHLPQADGAWSFVSGTRIDHVLASPRLHIGRCEYVREIGGVILASPDRGQRVSDHAALVADVSLGSAGLRDVRDALPAEIKTRHEKEPTMSDHSSPQENAVPSAPPYAAAGSQRWLQVAVAEHPGILDSALVEAGAIDPDEGMQWKSPIAATGFEEYRDGAALRLLGIQRLARRDLQQFWPSGGPVWDALAISTKGRVLLIEAKAHIAEAASPASRASDASLKLIRRSLDEARHYYSPRATADWSGPLYQYGNRLAFQYLLRTLNGLDSRLVFLNFCNAPDVRSPESRKEWEGATELIHALLGLPSDLRKHGVFHAYVDVRSMLGNSASGDIPLRER